MGTGGSYPGSEAPYSDEVKNVWSYTSTPPYAFCDLWHEKWESIQG